LKPAWEPIVLARKPLRGTVAGNVTEYGTGALNIDGCRIGIRDGDRVIGGALSANGRGEAVDYGAGGYDGTMRENTAGRWPANVILTDPIFDGDTPGVVGGGETGPSTPYVWAKDRQRNDPAGFGMPFDREAMTGGFGDSGTYSRFFLVPKSSRSDREPVIDEYAYALHRERGECDKLGAWSTSPARATSEARSTDDSSSDTSPHGKPPTVPSLTAIRSTTSTATSRTTDSTTSYSSIPSPTSGSTPGANSETASGGSPAESVASSSLWDEPTGTSPLRAGPSTVDAGPATSGSWSSRNVCGRCGKPLPRVATHPTQKPTDLMRHLVRLVTPPGGVVLDPFLGSGTTALAAEMEGFEWVGIEREAEYVAIAEARLNGTQRGLGLVS
jgi:hypothetical protein